VEEGGWRWREVGDGTGLVRVMAVATGVTVASGGGLMLIVMVAQVKIRI
jgi:hypothetical protein